MTNLYWYGLVIAGLFNFLPGRLVNRAVLGDARADYGLCGDHIWCGLPFGMAA